MNIVFFSKYLNSSINEHHVRQQKGLKQATREAQPTEENVKLQPQESHLEMSQGI